jgi:hypothetical protein
MAKQSASDSSKTISNYGTIFGFVSPKTELISTGVKNLSASYVLMTQQFNA